MQYTGSTAQSTDRNIRLGSGTNSIDASGTGSGTLSFTHTGTNPNLFQGTTSPNLTLTGSNMGNNTFALNLNMGVSLVKNGSGTWVYSGADSSSSGITVSNGTLTLSNTNTYTGITTISGGTLIGTNKQAFGTGANAAGQITFGSGVTGTLSMLNDGGTGTVTGQTIIYGGTTVSNNGYNVTTTSATTPTFNVGNNGNAGSTGNTIQLGTLTTNSTPTNTFTNANGYNLSFAGGATSTGGATFTNNMTNGTLTLASFASSAASTQTVTFGGTSATATTTVSGVISASNGANALKVTQSGSGTLTLNGTGNSYTGATTISAGTLSLSGTLTGGTAISTSGAGVLSETSTGGISGASSISLVGTGTSTLAGTNSYTGATGVSTGTLSLTGSLTGSNVATSGTGIVTESSAGVIAGSGVTFTQGSSGTTIFSGANTYTGGTTVTAGTLQQGVANAIGAASANALAVNGGTFDLNGFNLSTTGLSGTGGSIINSNSTAATLTNTGTTNATVASVLGGTGGNNFALVQSGSNVLTLSGAGTFTGGVTVNSGAINLNSATGAGTGTITLANSSALIYNGSNFNNALNITGTNILVNTANDNDGYHTGAITGGGTLTVGSVVVNGTTYTPVSSFKYSGDLSGFTGTFIDNVNTNVIFQGSANAGSASAKFQINGSGFNPSNNTATVFNMGELSGSSGGNFTPGGTLNLSVGALNTNSTYAGKFGTATNLTKVGIGTLTLSGIENSSTVNTVNAGTLQFAQTTALNNSTTPTAAQLNVKSGATVAFNVGGTGEFTATNLNNVLTNASVAASTTSGLQAGAIIGLDTTNASGGSFTQGNVIANSTGNNGGAIGLTKLGSGTLVLNQANTYTGGTAVNGGTLLVNGSISSSTGGVNVASGATLGGGTTTTPGTIGGATTVAAGGTITGGLDGSAVGATMPGTIGTLNLTSTLTINGTYVADISGATSDKLAITGAVNATAGALVNFVVNQTLTASSYVLATYASITGTFTSNTVPTGYQLDQSNTALTLDMVGVPEPSTWLGGCFLLGTVAYSQRRRFAGLVALAKAA